MTLSRDRSATSRLSLVFFVAQLLQLAGFTRQHPRVLFLPTVERLLRDPDLAADVADRHPGPDLLQHGGNLLDGKALLFHGTPSRPVGPIVPQNSPTIRSEKPG